MIALAIAGAAGLVAPLTFTAVVIVQSVLQSDYSAMALPVSALAAWPLGWLQNLNFFTFGALMIVFAVGLHRGVGDGHRGGIAGPALLTLSGAGVVVAGSFPWRGAGGDFVVPAGHVVGAVLAFGGAGAGLVALARRLGRDARWRSLRRYVAASGWAILALFVATMTLARSADAPLHGWIGLLQRITLAIWFPCTMLLAWRLRRLTTDPAARPKEMRWTDGIS